MGFQKQSSRAIARCGTSAEGGKAQLQYLQRLLAGNSGGTILLSSRLRIRSNAPRTCTGEHNRLGGIGVKLLTLAVATFVLGFSEGSVGAAPETGGFNETLTSIKLCN